MIHSEAWYAPSERRNSKSQNETKRGEKMSETILNARTAGSQPAVHKSTDRLTCDEDDSTHDSDNAST